MEGFEKWHNTSFLTVEVLQVFFVFFSHFKIQSHLWNCESLRHFIDSHLPDSAKLCTLSTQWQGSVSQTVSSLTLTIFGCYTALLVVNWHQKEGWGKVDFVLFYFHFCRDWMTCRVFPDMNNLAAYLRDEDKAVGLCALLGNATAKCEIAIFYPVCPVPWMDAINLQSHRNEGGIQIKPQNHFWD